MKQHTSIRQWILIYKNYKLVLLSFYLLTAVLLYLNWDYLYQNWLAILLYLYDNENIYLGILLCIYYAVATIYLFSVLYLPLLIFDKKHENNYKVSLPFHYLSKEYLRGNFLNISLVIVGPILMLLILFLWIVVDIVSRTIIPVFLAIGFVFFVLLIFIICVKYLLILIKNHL